VLAREVQVHAPYEYDPAPVFGALREAFPSCFVFCVGRGEATLRIAEIFSSAGLPQGALNVVLGGKAVVDRLVDHPEGAPRAACEPVGDPESLEGAVVFPRSSGNACLFRSLDRGRSDAFDHHDRIDGLPLCRLEPIG